MLGRATSVGRGQKPSTDLKDDDVLRVLRVSE